MYPQRIFHLSAFADLVLLLEMPGKFFLGLSWGHLFHEWLFGVGDDER